MTTSLKILVFAGLVMSNFACNNTAKTDERAAAKNDADTTAIVKAADTLPNNKPEVINEIEIAYRDSIDFEKYQVGPQKRLSNAPIDWSSYPAAKDFKTRITESYKDSEVSFGGHYVTSIFGCGASCIMGFMVDVRDGKIYDLPLGEENSCLFAEDRAVYNWMSRLFIAGVCKENLEDTKVYYKAYLWNEDKKEFEKIEAEAFLKK
ncbi:MAG: hypothetical protein EOO96_09280 [Pedobacter sp.]|nr:MAG: hypothetical protein EOO96_09280 [Pedobacter sp.]